MTRIFSIIILGLTINLHGQGVVCLIPTDTTCSRHFDQDRNVYFYSNPDKLPEFVGGKVELLKYVMRNLKLTTDTCGYSIKAFIQIQIDGTPTLLELLYPKDCKNLEIEMKRIVNEMPKWIPAKCKEQNVESRLVLPLKIRLQ